MFNNLKSKTLPGLAAVVVMLSGILVSLVGGQPVMAQTTLPAQWQPTQIKLSGTLGSDTHTCFDATQANTLQVEASTAKSDGSYSTDTYAINWKTGDRKPLTAAQFALCSYTGGLLGLNQTQNAKPLATNPDRYPSTFAHDGNQLFYDFTSTTPGNPDASTGSYLYVSKDGATWEKRPHLFAGKAVSSWNLAVPDNDSNTVYVLDCVQGAATCTLNLSRDAGMTWQIINNAVKAGIATRIQVIGGHDTPYTHLILTQDGTESFLNISTDGGKTFIPAGSYFPGSPSKGFTKVSFYEASSTILRFENIEDQSAVYTTGKVHSYKLDASTNGGKDWQALTLPPTTDAFPMDLTQFPYAPSSLLFSSGGGSEAPLWLSTDFGKNWQKLPSLPAPAGTDPSNLNLTPPVIAPYTPTTLLKFFGGQLFTLDVSQADHSIPGPTNNNLAVGGNFYPPTSHNLAPIFHGYWEKYGGLAQFGYPKTELFRQVNPADDKVYYVQYFERARFEWHPEFAGTPYEVELGLLGNQLTADRRTAGETPFNRVANPNSKVGMYFEQTGHTLNASFLQYWQQHGGLAIYGYPISEEFQEKNPDDGQTYTVQYFERNRFEYHPEFKNTQYEVLLGLLGNRVLNF